MCEVRYGLRDDLDSSGDEQPGASGGPSNAPPTTTQAPASSSGLSNGDQKRRVFAQSELTEMEGANLLGNQAVFDWASVVRINFEGVGGVLA